MSRDNPSRRQGATRLSCLRQGGSQSCVCVLFERVVVDDNTKQRDLDTDGLNVATAVEIRMMWVGTTMLLTANLHEFA